MHIPKEELIRKIKEIIVSKVEQNKFRKDIDDLVKGKPIQQIVGSIEFNGVNVVIDNSVLIPRPETEYLADLLTKSLRKVLKDRDKNLPLYNILEVGIGSGAISISLAHNLKDYSNFHITGIDISKKAIDVTKKNIKNNLILSQIDLKTQEIGLFGSTEVFDLIISNPPYIPSKKIKYLNSSVKNFEPQEALDGGEDGLNIIREILNFAISNYSALKPDQVIVLEINSKRQFNTIKREFKGTFNTFKLLKDQYGRYRFAVISKTTSKRLPYPLL